MLKFALISLASAVYAKSSITANSWLELHNTLDGSVTLPTDSSYVDEYISWTSTYDHIYPEAIIDLGSEADAVKVMQFLKNEVDEDGVWPTWIVRNCKHNFDGWSTTEGIIVSTQQLQTLELTDDNTVLVGPGVSLSVFTAWAEENDITLPHGDCASVCFGGFLLGGGFGLTSKTFGIGADWIKSIHIVTADGELKIVDADGEYSDLFWALRGGGQSNFGIITQFEMNIPEKKQQNPGLYVEITWEYTEDNWNKISSIWNQFTQDESYGNHFAIYLRISPTTYLSQDYNVQFHGFWTGEQTDGLMMLAKLLESINITPDSAKIDYVPFEGWIDSSSSDRLRYASHCKSRFAFDKFDDDFFSLINTRHMELVSYEPVDDTTYAIPTQFTYIAPAGGAISNHASDETVFPWRDATYLFVTCARWMNDYDDAETTAKQFLRDLIADLVDNEYLNGNTAFVNFPDYELENWQYAYYGDNYERLQTIKAKYDPSNAFSYSCSIEGSTTEDSTTEISTKLRHRERAKDEVTLYDKKLSGELEKSGQSFSLNKLNISEMWAYIIGGFITLLLVAIVIRSSKSCKKSNKLNKSSSPLSYYTKLETNETDALIS